MIKIILELKEKESIVECDIKTMRIKETKRENTLNRLIREKIDVLFCVDNEKNLSKNEKGVIKYDK